MNKSKDDLQRRIISERLSKSMDIVKLIGSTMRIIVEGIDIGVRR